MTPFLEPESWVEEDEIPWDFDAGGSLENYDEEGDD